MYEYSDDNIFYNANLFNGSGGVSPANYIETRTSPLILKPSDYWLTVARFSIPGSFLPIFIAQAAGFGVTGNVNILEYSVTLTYNGNTSGQTYLVWDPNYNTVTKPIIPVFTAQQPVQDPYDNYYYVFSYIFFLDLINSALSRAFTALGTYPAGVTQPPYMTYNKNNGIFTMWAQTGYSQSSNPMSTSNLQIWFNTSLYSLFPSFEILFNGFDITTGQNCNIVIKNNLDNTATLATGGTGYFMDQEFSTLYSWNSLQSVSFRSNNIPVNTQAITGFSSNGQTQPLQGGSANTVIAYLEDFEPLNGVGNGEFREILQYIPSVYRWSDLIGNNPLSTLDISVLWTDRMGYSHVLYIPPGGVLTIKLLFRKKDTIACG